MKIAPSMPEASRRSESGGLVLAFQPRAKSARAPHGWAQDEIAEAYRIVDLLARAGLAVHLVSGFSDEGDPWSAVLRDDNEEVIVHFARIDGRVVLVSASSEKVFSGHSLAVALRSVMEAQPLILPTGGGRLFLHPATILAAVIATALAHASREDAALYGVAAGRDADQRMVTEINANVARQAEADPVMGLLAAAVASIALAFVFAPEEDYFSGALPAVVGLDLDDISTDYAAALVAHEVVEQFSPERFSWLNDGSAEGIFREDMGASLVRYAEAAGRAVPPRAAEGANFGPLDQHEDFLVSLGLAGQPDDRGAPMWRLAAADADHPAEVLHASGAAGEREEGAQDNILGVTSVSSQVETPPLSQDELIGLNASSHPFFILASGERLYWEGAVVLGVVSPSADDASNLRASSGSDHQLFDGSVLNIPEYSQVYTVSKEVSVEVKASAMKAFVWEGTRELAPAQDLLADIWRLLENMPVQREVERVVLFEADDVKTDLFMMFEGVVMLRADTLYEGVHELALDQQIAFEMLNGEIFRLLGVVDI